MSDQKSFFQKALTRIGLSKKYKKSYSQTGEDLIVDFILNAFEISRPSYLDIGAFDYCKMSNTYLFYLRGSKGVCIEPDPTLFEKFSKKRPNDTCLNIGLTADGDSKKEFYIMSHKTLNTFSPEEVKKNESMGFCLKKTIKIDTYSINEIIGRYFTATPNFISLDVEGLDLEILQQLDFNRYRPDVLCVETVDFMDGKEVKNEEIIRLLKSKNYSVFADTHINTIFVDNNKWLKVIGKYTDSKQKK